MRTMNHHTQCHSALVSAVARATGESVLEISRRGFHSAMPLDVRFDPEPPARSPKRLPGCDDELAVVDEEPEIVDIAQLGIDWEALLDEPLEQSCEPVTTRVGGAT